MDITTSVADNIGIDYDDYRTEYSGRGMYGASCFAIVTSDSSWALHRSISENHEGDDPSVDEAVEYLLDHEPRVDSMGVDYVYYWPGLHVTDEGDQA